MAFLQHFARLALAATSATFACSGRETASTPSAVETAPPTAPSTPTPEPAPTPAAKTSDAPKPAALGQRAPNFTLPDLAGQPHDLKAHAGKIVVLEWFNPECPFVNYAHEQGPLKTMAADLAAKDVVWLAINSGAANKQGHGAQANQAGASKFGLTHPILLDESGEVGRLYGAKKTPHMYVIDKDGTLVYAGGIDNAPFGEVDGEDPVTNYVAAAVASLEAGKPVEVGEYPAYGCTVKYGS